MGLNELFLRDGGVLEILKLIFDFVNGTYIFFIAQNCNIYFSEYDYHRLLQLDSDSLFAGRTSSR